MSEECLLTNDTVVGNRFKIIKQVGKGSFGEVYKAYDSENKHNVAIKIEKKEKSKRLLHEFDLYANLDGMKGIPKMYWKGNHNDNNVIAMEYLGPSLDELFQCCDSKFTPHTICLIGIQIMHMLEGIHKGGILHRDIKPDNFLIGYGKNQNKIYIIDLGLSKYFMDSNKKSHIAFRQNKGFTGSFRYSSIRNHKGYEQSRRDDLESVAYMLLYMLKGKLPWQGVKESDKSEKCKKICNLKETITLQELCKDVPPFMFKMMRYIRFLRFVECPDYEYLRKLMYNYIIQHNNESVEYDWIRVLKQKSKSNTEK